MDKDGASEFGEGIFLHDYSFKMFDGIEFIGKGACSSVVKALHRKSGKFYAIKIVQ